MRQAKQLMVDTSGLSDVERYGKVSNFVRTHIIQEVMRQLGQTAVEMMDWLKEGAKVPARPNWMPRRKPSASVGTEPDDADAPYGFVSRQALGRRYQFSENDPIVTGEMIDVVSSNVHSIGYDWNWDEPNKGTLKVRFLAKRKNRARVRGPLYFYFNVHPEVFMAFQHASSKGKFVWDRLRVRGTVSGSRFHYELEDLGATGYVPRKATRLGPNEHFLQRQFTDASGRTHTSQLEDEFVQRIGANRHGPQGFVPMRGTPNRGRPQAGH